MDYCAVSGTVVKAVRSRPVMIRVWTSIMILRR